MSRIYMDGGLLRKWGGLEGGAKITLEQQQELAKEIKQWRFDPSGNLITTSSDKEFLEETAEPAKCPTANQDTT